MLSRTADNMYWLARYVERAEYLARILEATQRLSAVPTSAGATTEQRGSCPAPAGGGATVFLSHPEADQQAGNDFRPLSFPHPSSLLSRFQGARILERA